MNILITAGGTQEKIDDVRSITNHSSGKLGKIMADTLFKKGHHIYYVTTPFAYQPENVTKRYMISSANDLKNTLENVMAEIQFDAVIHAMAVSDFTLDKAFSEEDILSMVSPKELFSETKLSQTEKKISSDTKHLVLVLKQNPKIIHFIKKWQPQTKLIGFKLLVDVTKEHLTNVALKSLVKNQADFIVANDLLEVGKDDHHALLVGPKGVVDEAFTKEGIALMIEKVLKEEKE